MKDPQRVSSRAHSWAVQDSDSVPLTAASSTNNADKPVATSATTSVNTAAAATPTSVSDRPSAQEASARVVASASVPVASAQVDPVDLAEAAVADPVAADAAGAVTCVPRSSSCSPTGRCTATR